MEKKVLKWKEYWTNLTWKSVIVRLVPLMLLALVLGTSPIWADYSKPISVKELPTTAQEMLKEWFPDSRIAFVEKEIEYFSKTYKVILADGMKLEFDRKGEWTTVDAKFHSVPSELVPQPILDYVREYYPGVKIVSIEKKKREYEIDLSNSLELKFNNKHFYLTDLDD